MDMLGDLQQLKAGVIRIILMRRITLGVFTVVAFPVAFFLRINLLDPLLYTPMMWLLLTWPFRALIEHRQTAKSLHLAHAAYFVAEIVLITVLVHRLGGITWIGGMFYVFTVLYASFFLPRLHGAVITGGVVVSYASLAIMEYFGVLPHHPLFAAPGPAHQNLLYILTTLLAGPVAVYALLALTVRTFAGIYERKNRLLAARETQLSVMSRTLLQAHDDERRRIARNLHDELIQLLAAVKLHLAPAREALGEPQLQKINSILDTAIDQTRTLAYSVRPPLLDDLGLVSSLQRWAEGLSEETGLEIVVRSQIDSRLDIALESLLFYVGQECLRNAVRHAGASRIIVQLDARQGLAVLSVQDNGEGFSSEGELGLGLQGVQERVEVCGGKLIIESAQGKGSCVTVEVPHPEDSTSADR